MTAVPTNILTRRAVVLVFGSVVAIAFGLLVAGLSLSDRAPAFTSYWVERLGRIFEHRSGIDIIDRSDVPWEFDAVGHFFLWATAGILAGVTLGRRFSAPFLIVALTSISAGVEYVQPILSATRKSQPGDLIANVLGITLGVVTVWLFGCARSGFRWVRNRLA